MRTPSTSKRRIIVAGGRWQVFEHLPPSTCNLPQAFLEAIDLRILPLEIREIRPGVERATGDALDELAGEVLAPVAVDVRAQPAEQAAELAALDVGRDGGHVLNRLLEELH